VIAIFVGAVAVLNVVFGWLNCRYVGNNWDVTKAVGGFWRLEVWAGAVMSAVGFSWVGMLLSGQLLMALDKMTMETYESLMDLGLFALALPLLFSTWTITAGSWVRVRRERSAVGMGLTAWNTGASLWNTFVIFRHFGSGLKVFGKAVSGNNQGRMLLLVVGVSIGLGTLATYLLTRHYVLESRRELSRTRVQDGYRPEQDFGAYRR
jgi:hypothetical protein